ncbi:AbrB family transcriptional regulator [Citreimonas sp.]|uniref:AbrB family transcriptional regulator n=1 Tax=Citreimonas sp. TaxID=3036715 RepID=UPI004058EB52
MPTMRMILTTAALLALGLAGGEVAVLLGLPMPWMLGSLAICAGLVLLVKPRVLEGYAFPMRFRSGFVALIGVMIGTQVTPELLRLAGELPWTVGGLILFVFLAHMGNMAVFQRLGGYDRATAFYAGTPGGLMESILLGEGAGADTRILTAQQFLRIIVTITVLPLALSLWMGEPVGSAAGLALASGDAAPADALGIATIAVAAFAGMLGAKMLRLPAAQLTGPMLIAAAATLSGVIDLHLPVWMIAAAQMVIGVSLGLRFQGLSMALLRRSAWLSVISVSYMLALGAGFAAVLTAITGLEWLHLLISFAPGGVAEMSVIALSLAANPALVSLHHILRILLTVVELTLLAKVLGLKRAA